MKGRCPTEPAAVAKARDDHFWKGSYIKAKMFAWGRQLATGIKGIYHEEGCGSYAQMASADNGGRVIFFVSAGAAEAQGFRKAKNCL